MNDRKPFISLLLSTRQAKAATSIKFKILCSVLIVNMDFDLWPGYSLDRQSCSDKLLSAA